MPIPLTLIQTGDLHLGSPFAFAGDKASQLKQTQLEVMIEIIQLCQHLEADVLLIAGDLFDQPVPDSTLVRTVSELLGSLSRTMVLIAPGNHDPASLDSPFQRVDWPDNVVIFKDRLEMIEWPEHQVRIHGCGFIATVAPQPLPFLPDGGLDQGFINLLIMHGDLDGQPNSPYNAVQTAGLSAAGYDYVALGHRHAFSGFLQEGKTTLAYAGCPFGRGFDETGPKGVIILRTSPNQLVLNPTYQSLGSRMFLELKVDVTDCLDQRQMVEAILDSLKKQVGETFSQHLYKIILTGLIDSEGVHSTSLIRTLLADRLFWFRLLDETRCKLDLDALALEHSLRGAYVRLAQSALLAASESNQPESMQLAQKALELGLAAMRGEEVWYETDPA